MLSEKTFDDVILFVLFIVIIVAIAAIIYLVREQLKDDDPTKGMFK